MKYDVLLATKDSDLARKFKKTLNKSRVRLEASAAPTQFGSILHKRRQILESVILDLTMPDIDVNRIIFYINQFKRDIPVFLLHGNYSIIKEREAFCNLSVYAYMKRTITKSYFEKLLDEMNALVGADMDKKLEKVDYLKQENVFACTFKNMKTYFLNRKDISDDDGTKIKRCMLDKDQYHFTVFLESGKEYVIIWDFIRYICDEEYEYYKENKKERISSEEIGKSVCQSRKQKKLRQEDLAIKTGMQRANISRIESGKHYPSLETLKKIADALSVPVAKFLAK